MVLVQWHDAVFDSDADAALTDDLSEFGGLSEREDIGFLVRIDKKELVLAITRDEKDNRVCYSNTIPRGWVKKIRLLQIAPDISPAPPASTTTDKK
jgi:hypothetical protein